jgi:hypothetical protein
MCISDICFAVCEAAHGSLLISGLSIIALAELFGLVYMRWMGKSVLFLFSSAKNFRYIKWKIILVDSSNLGPKKCIIIVKLRKYN